MALASLVSFQEQQQKQKCIRYAHASWRAKASKFAPFGMLCYYRN